MAAQQNKKTTPSSTKFIVEGVYFSENPNHPCYLRRGLFVHVLSRFN
ncbi:Hypothetical protein CpCAP1R_1719 [Corynebacterium pseudotuberculosis]|nr:hypothetical protein CPTA_00058 [Corynebacterium pseudotuberculosis]AIG09525.1 hypothetical protein CPTB_01469 [Corynebacterium pseudotuberculosis]AIG10330.1 hypothetical protein CPTC_00042 [Corynebacterium pseudotuberculosis]AQL51794.1 hypothetical protein CpPA04_1704 [Corynebacterium pseudotuberculosis]QBG77873.1 Hypothetical protein CpCAP1R_1719 [Corynebacterium pseudotuberculosis]